MLGGQFIGIIYQLPMGYLMPKFDSHIKYWGSDHLNFTFLLHFISPSLQFAFKCSTFSAWYSSIENAMFLSGLLWLGSFYLWHVNPLGVIRHKKIDSFLNCNHNYLKSYIFNLRGHVFKITLFFGYNYFCPVGWGCRRPPPPPHPACIGMASLLEL